MHTLFPGDNPPEPPNTQVAIRDQKPEYTYAALYGKYAGELTRVIVASPTFLSENMEYANFRQTKAAEEADKIIKTIWDEVVAEVSGKVESRLKLEKGFKIASIIGIASGFAYQLVESGMALMEGNPTSLFGLGSEIATGCSAATAALQALILSENKEVQRFSKGKVTEEMYGIAVRRVGNRIREQHSDNEYAKLNVA